jgi:hypothetical protein
VKPARCKPARRTIGYQVVYFDATGRQVAWAPYGPQKTVKLALRHLNLFGLPGCVVGHAVVRRVEVETVVRQQLLEKRRPSRQEEFRARP